MVGKYEIEVYNNRVHFYLEVKRNITIIQGHSATGKTTLIGLLSDYGRLGSGSGVTVKCDKTCAVLDSQDWKHFISSRKEHIIFIDENMPFLRSNDFAEAVAASDNYYVIIYRDSLPKLAYSINEIYGMHEDRESQKYIKPKRVYNTLFNIYTLHNETPEKPDLIITEDSNSGHEFFCAAAQCKCITAGGKSKVAVAVAENAEENKNILAVVDGAAFGADMQRFSRTARDSEGKSMLYAPESFEYLILQSGMIEVDSDIVDQPYNHADSSKYLSWERFFTVKLADITRNTIFQYSKQRLNKIYLTEGNMRIILQNIPDIITDLK